jgi:membrane fusion protein, macrolide-specific efflux system
LDSFVVDADATTSQIAQLQVGEQAVITPTGSDTTAYGVVTSISKLGTTSSGVTTFPVTITVTGNPSGLYAGAEADLEIIVSQVTNVLVVPTTAVHSVGTSSIVYLLQNGKEVAQPVTVGATSGTYTQVKSGLKSGQEVVIASLSARIPSSTSGSTGSGRASFGGLGGGGFSSFSGGSFSPPGGLGG